jgi:3-hydroxyisobutyrate dehydrogenase-like beta-hydroxyacid dehydrogenase
MNGIDEENYKDIEEEINEKGGSYIEEKVKGSKKKEEEGKMVIMEEGDS